jgi:hypothetical protein
MTRTHRYLPDWRFQPYKKPKTTSEIRANKAIFSDIAAGDIDQNISGINRMHRNIPTHYDDIILSSYYETKHIPKDKINNDNSLNYIDDWNLCDY